jgi:hypothetical protein
MEVLKRRSEEPSQKISTRRDAKVRKGKTEAMRILLSFTKVVFHVFHLLLFLVFGFSFAALCALHVENLLTWPWRFNLLT